MLLEEAGSAWVSQSHGDGVYTSATSPPDPPPPTNNTQLQRHLLPSAGTVVPEPAPPLPTTGRQQGHDRNYPLSQLHLQLPQANVTKIMKNALPADSMIAKDAKEDMERCAREFIQFLTSEAADTVSFSERPIIFGGDILDAMHNTGFENYAAALRPYLRGYRARKDVPSQK